MEHPANKFNTADPVSSFSRANEDPILFNNPWLQLRLRDDWYVYSHSPKSNGHGVVILGFDSSGEEDRVLARLENCPVHPHNYDDGGVPLGVTSLSGMVDDFNLSLRETAAKELYEESGIKVDPDDFMSMGEAYGSKASDYCDHLFGIDLAGKVPTETTVGDGTKGEVGSRCIWMDATEYFMRCNSPTPALIWMRIHLIRNNIHACIENNIEKLGEYVDLIDFDKLIENLIKFLESEKEECPELAKLAEASLDQIAKIILKYAPIKERKDVRIWFTIFYVHEQAHSFPQFKKWGEMITSLMIKMLSNAIAKHNEYQ